MIDSLKNRIPSLASINQINENKIDRSLEIMAAVSSIYLCIFYFLPEVAIKLLGFSTFLSGIAIIKAVAIIMDLNNEFVLRKKSNNLVKIAEFHDVPKVGLLKTIFEQKGMPCLLKGYYHRSLLYFFGPYIEISVLVPENRSIEARELINRYIE